MTTPSSWFDDPAALLDELRRGGEAARAPKIPGYADLRELDRGGQGVVYSAVQRSTGQRVAIKVLADRPFTSQSGRRRFEREIEVVTALRHPNIVRVYDSGATSDGRLYSVMEYIEGVPLDEWIADWRLGIGDFEEGRGPAQSAISNRQSAIDKALPLFLKVCDAVHYAHQRGVVHRDLKPGNIRIDSAGEPHILDFGLAKDTAGPAESLAVSVAGQFMGSVPWASPEQANCFPDGIDVRTDVYSLGVVLYQMLTGRFPYEVVGPIRDVLDNILKAEPARPRKINPGIDDELETIVLKCLAKEPERRYQGAGELAADIRHYLADEPIEAKRDSTSYVLRKNLRRYRWPLAAAGAFVLVLFASSVIAWTLYVEARTQRTEARQAADRLARTVYVEQITRAYEDYQQNGMAAMRSRLNNADACPEALRGWEWDYLSRLAKGSEETLRGHTDGIAHVVFSPDGRRIASASCDGTIKLWDIASGREIKTFSGHQNQVYGVAFWPDGKRIASASPDQTLRIWDVETGKQVDTLLSGHGQLASVAVSPSGDVIVTGNGSGSLDIWGRDRDTWRLLHESLLGHQWNIDSLDFTSDGGRILTGSRDSIRLWDVASGVQIRQYAATSFQDSQPITTQSARFRRGDQQFVALGPGFEVRIHDAATGQIVRTLSGHMDIVQAAAWSPDGRWIASAGQDATVRVWDAVGEHPPWVLRGHEQLISSVAFSPDGCWIASAGADRTIRLWRHPAADRGRDGFNGPVFSIQGYPLTGKFAPQFGPGDRLFVMGSHGLAAWDCQSGEMTILPFVHHSGSFTVSPDGRWLALSCRWRDRRSEKVNSQIVILRSSADGKEVGRTPVFPAECASIAFSPDGRFLAAGSQDEGAQAPGIFGVDVWDVTQPGRLTVVRRFRGHDENVQAVAYDHSGERIVSASSDRTLRVWDALARTKPLILRDHEGPVTCACFSPDGALIASASEDATCRLWDATTGQVLQKLVGHQAIVASVAFHPDSRRLVSGGRDGKAIIWDVETGRSLLALDSGGADVTAAFSPDGKVLATATSDGVRLWETASPSPEVIRQRLVLGAAHQIVDPILADQLILPEEAIERLRGDPNYEAMDEEERAAAERLIALHGEAYSTLATLAWQHVERQIDKKTSPEEQRRIRDENERAYRLARYVCEHVSPVEFRHTLGVAEYRTGRFEDALKTLGRTTQERGYPHDRAFLAMTLYQLGRIDEARDCLREARQLIDDGNFNQPEIARFIEEAAALLGAPIASPQ